MSRIKKIGFLQKINGDDGRIRYKNTWVKIKKCERGNAEIGVVIGGKIKAGKRKKGGRRR